MSSTSSCRRSSCRRFSLLWSWPSDFSRGRVHDSCRNPAVVRSSTQMSLKRWPNFQAAPAFSSCSSWTSQIRDILRTRREVSSCHQEFKFSTNRMRQSPAYRRAVSLLAWAVDTEVICYQRRRFATPATPVVDRDALAFERVANTDAGSAVAVQGQNLTCECVVDRVERAHRVDPARCGDRTVTDLMDDIHVQPLTGFFVVLKPRH